MSSIKKVITLSFALLLMLNLATAQRGQGNQKIRNIENVEAFAQQQTQRLTERLSLTEDQSAKVAAIHLEYAQKLQAAQATATGKEAFKALRTEQNAAIKTVLTPEQITQMEQKRGGKGKGAKKGGKGKGGKRGGEGKAQTAEEKAAKHTERLTEKLSLTEAQTATIAAINLDYANKMEAAKATATDKEAGKAARKSLRTAQQTAIKAVLNAEQLVAYDALKSERKGKKRGGKLKKQKKE